jgi:TonB-linked SusC/RagA family outer membrane protein
MKRILLLCLTAVAMLASGVAWAQERTVTGRVTSAEDNTPIPGVNVVVKGTTVGTVTDASGAYSISAPADGTLVFSFIGLTSQEIAIGNRTAVDVSMAQDVQQLTEVVITALGVEKSEKAVTYAVQDVSGEGLVRARESNIINSLSGQIAGAQITNSSGAVGGSTRVVLRGANSISGSNQPLFVVDGVPINNENYSAADNGGGADLPNGAAAINPDDVESISVLKGPVGAALYGNRGANGVIIVTTKTGRGTKGLGISVNSTTYFETPLRTPDFQNSYGQGPAPNYFEFVNGQSGYGDGVDESWGAPLDAGLNFIQWSSYPNLRPEPWVSYPNNVRDFYQTGVTTSNNIAVSGDNGKGGVFRLSATNMNQKGMVPNTELARNTINGSASLRIAEKLEASLSANYIKEHSDNFVQGGYNNLNPVQQTIWSGRNVNLAALKNWRNLPLAPEGTAAEGTPINWNTVFQNNPYWAQDINTNPYDKDRIIGNVKLSYQFNDWLSAYVRSGIDSWSSLVANRVEHGTNSLPDGFYSQVSRRWYETNHFFLATINKDFTEDIGFNFNFGGNLMDQVYQRSSGEVPALLLPGVFTLNNLKSGSVASISNRYERQKINSVLFSGQVSFRDYLFVDFTGRNDWWSVLPKDNNSYFYPSVSVSAVVSDMLQIDSKALSYLKVRAGWSKVGSSGGLSPYSIQQTYQFNADPWGDVSLLINPNTLNNPNLKPETVTGIELGVDTKLFNEKIDLKVTYFRSLSEDLIVPLEISPSSGYEFAYVNAGEMTNKGIEVQLGANIVRTSDFTADVRVNFAKFNNMVEKVNEIPNDEAAIVRGGQWSVDLQAREGYPFGVLFGPAYVRTPEGRLVHGSDGLPIIATELKVLGDIQPDWAGGFNLDLGYKNFSLNTLIDAKMGGDLYTMTTTWGRYSGVLSETLKGREDGIVGDGVKIVGTDEDGNTIYAENDLVVPAEDYNKRAFQNEVAEGSVFDASYVKLRQVQLTYRLPNKIWGRFPIRDFSVSFVGRNLALLYSRIPHVDPESAFSSADTNQGLEFGQIPSARSLGFNINFKL